MSERASTRWYSNLSSQSRRFYENNDAPSAVRKDRNLAEMYATRSTPQTRAKVNEFSISIQRYDTEIKDYDRRIALLREQYSRGEIDKKHLNRHYERLNAKKRKAVENQGRVRRALSKTLHKGRVVTVSSLKSREAKARTIANQTAREKIRARRTPTKRKEAATRRVVLTTAGGEEIPAVMVAKDQAVRVRTPEVRAAARVEQDLARFKDTGYAETQGDFTRVGFLSELERGAPVYTRPGDRGLYVPVETTFAQALGWQAKENIDSQRRAWVKERKKTIEENKKIIRIVERGGFIDDAGQRKRDEILGYRLPLRGRWTDPPRQKWNTAVVAASQAADVAGYYAQLGFKRPEVVAGTGGRLVFRDDIRSYGRFSMKNVGVNVWRGTKNVATGLALTTRDAGWMFLPIKGSREASVRVEKTALAAVQQWKERPLVSATQTVFIYGALGAAGRTARFARHPVANTRALTSAARVGAGKAALQIRRFSRTTRWTDPVRHARGARASSWTKDVTLSSKELSRMRPPSGKHPMYKPRITMNAPRGRVESYQMGAFNVNKIFNQKGEMIGVDISRSSRIPAAPKPTPRPVVNPRSFRGMLRNRRGTFGEAVLKQVYKEYPSYTSIQKIAQRPSVIPRLTSPLTRSAATTSRVGLGSLGLSVALASLSAQRSLTFPKLRSNLVSSQRIDARLAQSQTSLSGQIQTPTTRQAQSQRQSSRLATSALLASFTAGVSQLKTPKSLFSPKPSSQRVTPPRKVLPPFPQATFSGGVSFLGRKTKAKRRTRYAPSLAVVIGGFKAPDLSGRMLTGLELRGLPQGVKL